MSNGIAHNNLNDISKIYLDTISDINKKEQEDDVKRWQQEESECGQNTRQQSPFKKKKVKAYKEAFSNWRKDLREVTSDAEAQEIDDQPEIKEKKVKNKIKINPEFKEAVNQMGGELLEVTELDDKKDDKNDEQDAAAAKKIADKERKLKMRILRVKMMATKSDAGASIVAGYEPDIEGAVEYFYEEGLNEEGIDQLIEEIGIEEFVNFVDESAVELNEERAARRATVRAKKYDVVKKEVDKADAARRKSKKGEYAPSYSKKETDVTVYDDKPSAKKKTPVKKAPAKKVSKKDYDGDGKKETPKAEHRGVRNKKITKAVAKVKKTQPAKKATKQGLGDKIRSAYKAGVKRHRKATQVPRVFAKGVAAGAKKAVKFAKDVKKVVSEEELLDEDTTRITKGRWVDKKGRSHKFAVTTHTGDEGHVGSIVKSQYPAKRVVITGQSVGKKKKVESKKTAAKKKKSKKVEEQIVTERLGGKGYKPRKDYAGRRVSGDWEDSDRGAGNKATRRAGGKVKKKSPTYQAYVLNKEENVFKAAMKKVLKKKDQERKPEKAMDAGARAKRVLQRKEYASKVSGSTENVPDDIRDGYEATKRGEVLSAFKRDPKVRKRFEKAAKKEGGPGSAKNRAADDMLQTAKNIAKRKGDTSKSDDRYAYEGYQRDPEQSKKDRTHSKQPDPSKDGFTGIGNMSIKDIMKMNAKMKKEKKVNEAKVDKGRSDYGKASIRNYRSKGPGYGEPAMFDPENKRGKLIDKRREEHKARRGVKGAKVPAYKVSEEKKKGLDGKACWKGYRLAGTKKKGGKTVDNCVKEEDKAFNYVVAKLRKQHGKDLSLIHI